MQQRQHRSSAESSRFWGLRFRLDERRRHSLIFIPSLYIVAALALGESVPRIEEGRDLLALELDPDTARTILSSIAGGMIAFTGLVVSIAILVVQFGASQYTPRLVNRFRRDPGVKHSLGIFIAPAIFALVAMRAVGESAAETTPSLTVVISLVLLCAAVLAFFGLVGGLLDLLRPRRLIGQIVDGGLGAINEVYPKMLEARQQLLPIPDLPVGLELEHAGRPGIVSAIDRGALVRAAAEAGGVIEVLVPVGSHVSPGTDLLRLRSETAAANARSLRRAIVVGEERTFTQDPAFAIRAIVDIALRALSPAVNDPTTAVQALDGLTALLLALGERDLQGRGMVSDGDGHARLVYRTPNWEHLLDLALTEIRHYGTDSPQIPRRMNALLDELRAGLPQPRQAEIERHAAALDRQIERSLPDPEDREHARSADRLGIGGG